MRNKWMCILLLLCILPLLHGCGNGEENYKATLYFLNAEGTALQPEQREIKKADSAVALANSVVSALIKGPDDPKLKAVFPPKTALTRVDVKNGIARIGFSADFTFEKEAESLFARAALVRSLCAIDGINHVEIFVNDEPYCAVDGTVLGKMNAQSFIDDGQLLVAGHKYVTLYFADEDYKTLLPESRTVKVQDSLEYTVVRELIKGPVESDGKRTVPEETKIISVETNEGICFVNLSSAFRNKRDLDDETEALTIYSVVNSLTELPGVNKVQFLIDGQKTDTYIKMVFNEPFTRNLTYNK